MLAQPTAMGSSRPSLGFTPGRSAVDRFRSKAVFVPGAVPGATVSGGMLGSLGQEMLARFSFLGGGKGASQEEEEEGAAGAQVKKITFVSKHVRCRPVMNESLWPGGQDQGVQDDPARRPERVLLPQVAAVPSVHAAVPQIPRVMEACEVTLGRSERRRAGEDALRAGRPILRQKNGTLPWLMFVSFPPLWSESALVFLI
jgi:hypothetical protein